MLKDEIMKRMFIILLCIVSILPMLSANVVPRKATQLAVKVSELEKSNSFFQRYMLNNFIMENQNIWNSLESERVDMMILSNRFWALTTLVFSCVVPNSITIIITLVMLYRFNKALNKQVYVLKQKYNEVKLKQGYLLNRFYEWNQMC
jgi:hypothetical protein